MMNDKSAQITERFRIGDFVKSNEHGWGYVLSMPRFGLACEAVKGPSAAEVECLFEGGESRCISVASIQWSVDRQMAAVFYSRVHQGLYTRNSMPPSDEASIGLALRLLNQGRMGLIKNDLGLREASAMSAISPH